MKFRVVAVGRGAPSPVQQLVDDYGGRLRHYGGCELVEVPHAPQRNAPLQESHLARAWERDKIITALSGVHDGERAAVLPMDAAGKTYDSHTFAQLLDRYQQSGTRTVTFLIGGPDGLDPALLETFPHPVSLGPMTFPHMLVRVMLLEQIYRAMTILHGHPYHR